MDSGKSFIEHAVDLYNTGDLDGYMDLYADDAVLATPDGTYEGRDKIHEYFAQQMAGFPDCRYILGDLVEQGDELADEFTWVGTHTAPYVLPDGNRATSHLERLTASDLFLLMWDDYGWSTDVGGLAILDGASLLDG